MKSILLSLTIIVFLAGCASTTQKAQVIGNKITNPTVGFNGYESTIPDGFHILEEGETVKTELGHYINKQVSANNSFASGGGYIRDSILMQNDAKGIIILIQVLEINLPVTLSQLPDFTHRKIAEETIKNISKEIEAKYTTHEALNIPCAIEYSGHTLNEEKRLQVSGFMKVGKLNELIAIHGATLSDPSLNAIIKQMFTDTIIH